MKEQSPIALGGWDRKSFTELFSSNATSFAVHYIKPPSLFIGEPSIFFGEYEIAALATPFHLCFIGTSFLMANRLCRYFTRNFILRVSSDNSQYLMAGSSACSYSVLE